MMGEPGASGKGELRALDTPTWVWHAALQQARLA
jgi:hypothetical protein